MNVKDLIDVKIVVDNNWELKKILSDLKDSDIDISYIVSLITKKYIDENKALEAVAFEYDQHKYTTNELLDKSFLVSYMIKFGDLIDFTMVLNGIKTALTEYNKGQKIPGLISFAAGREVYEAIKVNKLTDTFYFNGNWFNHACELKHNVYMDIFGCIYYWKSGNVVRKADLVSGESSNINLLEALDMDEYEPDEFREKLLYYKEFTETTAGMTPILSEYLTKEHTIENVGIIKNSFAGFQPLVKCRSYDKQELCNYIHKVIKKYTSDTEYSLTYCIELLLRCFNNKENYYGAINIVVAIYILSYTSGRCDSINKYELVVLDHPYYYLMIQKILLEYNLFGLGKDSEFTEKANKLKDVLLNCDIEYIDYYIKDMIFNIKLNSDVINCVYSTKHNKLYQFINNATMVEINEHGNKLLRYLETDDYFKDIYSEICIPKYGKIIGNNIKYKVQNEDYIVAIDCTAIKVDNPLVFTGISCDDEVIVLKQQEFVIYTSNTNSDLLYIEKVKLDK